jgi:hypothetical protein
MNRNLRIGTTLLAALLASGLVACTSSETSAGGTGGTVAPPDGTGGTVGPSGTGGAGPVAGTTGSTQTDGIACLPIGGALISDFTYAPLDGGTPSPTQVRFGSSGTAEGGTAVWTNSTTFPLNSDVTQGSWHISGTIDNYAGFNLYFDNCNHIDAKAYKGIQFKISGSLGGGALRMGMGTLNDAVAASWLIGKGDTSAKPTDAGRCVPKSGTNKYDQSDCKDPEAAIPVTPTPTPVVLAWTDLTGGKPVPNVEPADIISIYWYFVWTSASYPVDIALDDLSFIP